MKFVLSFSGGKDSILSLDRLIKNGHTPLGLFIMYNEEAGRSWFHGIDGPLLEKISESLKLPLLIYPTGGEAYHLAIRKALERAKAEGADAVAFGDIDVKENREWCECQCDAAGIQGIFPLWNEAREKLVREVVSRGYECVIKCVRNENLPQSFLGRKIDESVIGEMQALGVDPSGEGGEFHTVVLDGPLFSFPVPVDKREIIDFGNISAINIVVAEK